ncbi:hypothetical protein G7Y89_g10420 [Cudoniella acicularis]|uniref:NACHT domain-containing protein n=1 Tax=Cudoniella acicularis TaxID=354080 RepID=A0A8H4VZ22_9HELO|nr:hypothetical protein G7Y89_g10420 [Cudoniella acicularis]
MATVELPIRATPNVVGAIWKAAISRYEEITLQKIESFAGVNSADEILDQIHERERRFKGYRHDGSKLDKFRSHVNKSLGPIEKLSNIVASAASTSFPPSTAIFTAVSYLIKAVNSVSADYDRIAGLFEDLDLYLSRLKILEKWVPPVLELEVALTEVLVSVLILCGICAKYIKMKRIVKAFRNLVSGEDDELSAAYAHFHKMVEQERGTVGNATLAAVGQLQQESNAIHTVVREGLAMTRQTDLNTKTLIASSEHLNKYLESKEAALERDDILTRLSSLDFHEKQKDTFAKHHQGTGQWLAKTEEFQQWFKGERVSVLWCPGIPGAGKTVMTSLTVNHVQEAIQGTKVAIAYIYCDYKNPKTQSELELFASITRQLTEQTSSMPTEVKEFCDKNAEKRRNPTGEEWIALAKSICLLFKTTYIFVDALDECPEINRGNFLCLMREMSPFVRLFITSRPHVHLNVKFANLLRIDISAQGSDIEMYLEHRISTHSRLSLFVAKDIRLQEDIVRTLSEKATGMFLLAHLQMDQLCRQSNLRAVRKMVSELPKGLSEFYKDALRRIEMQPEEDSELARRTLSYLFYARRPLNVEELRHLLGVEVGDNELDPTAFPEIEIVLNVSAGLIRIDGKSNSVGLVHYSLQEYLQKNGEILLPDPEVEMARVCLTYLSFDVFEGGPCQNGDALQQRLREYQLLNYASHHWGCHIMGDQLHETVVGLVLAFLKDEQKLACLVQVLHAPTRQTQDWYNCFPRQFGPLHAVAWWGLDKILVALSEPEMAVDCQDSYGATSLQIAAQHGHRAVAQLLLDLGADIDMANECGETALYWAAKSGHSALVELLLLNGARVLTKDNEGWTALDWAVVGGNNEVVKMLLEHGADTAANNDGLHKALHLAAEEGHELTHRARLRHAVRAPDDGAGAASTRG